jgi:hypothetical protein
MVGLWEVDLEGFVCEDDEHFLGVEIPFDDILADDNLLEGFVGDLVEIPQEDGVQFLEDGHSEDLFVLTGLDLGDGLHDLDGPGFLDGLAAVVEVDGMPVVEDHEARETHPAGGFPIEDVLLVESKGEGW